MRSSNVLKRCSLLIAFICILMLTGCGRIPDGEYAASVTLTGGSGRAYVESPCKVTVSGQTITADIVWSSPNYDFMMVDGVRYEPVNSEGNSEFIIPVKLGKEMSVQADTTAMSTPHLIDYTLKFEVIDGGEADPEASGEGALEEAESKVEAAIDEAESLLEHEESEEDIVGFITERLGKKIVSTDDITYATGFKIYRLEGDYVLISVRDSRYYLIIPEDTTVSGLPELGEGIVSLSPIGDPDVELVAVRRPIDSIYLAASAVMCQFDAIDAIDLIKLSGTQRDDWYVDAAKDAMDAGSLLYGGKYSAPDYEMMVDKDVDLAIDNTMILHSPKVIEKLEKLGIPTFVDWSSYEESILGRLEWIKVYGVLSGKEDEAAKVFLQQKQMVEAVDAGALKGKSVAVFSVNTRHQICTKKGNDYLVKIIEAAGGTYLMPEGVSDDNNQSQVTISVEAFYQYAREADILIYNAVIEDAPGSLSDLAGMDSTFGDFEAVKSGEVYVVSGSLYQLASKSGSIAQSVGEVLSGEKEKTDYIYKLK
ncbi:ABC transporter substrate-binding protein [Butyrivibrio sp. CB08]|uniref:ABC transporter substrate-binding protein n=1 Tax=Butyrivibrio sp. CB08 TaxID=2364879 RepID=UPI001314DA57|nr:ABC transporter substrate-binding protein [Butyrivibrio sp. CB08]